MVVSFLEILVQEINRYEKERNKKKMNREYIQKKLKSYLLEDNSSEKRIDFNIPVPSDLEQIKNVFVENGRELYIVGGAVFIFNTYLLL